MDFKAYESSSAQKRLYIINDLLGNSILYNESRVWVINGNLDPIRLENSIKQNAHRHESLRTCFLMKDGQVLQKVFEHIDVDFKYSRCTSCTSGDIETMIDGFIKSYDLGKVPLWKIELVQVNDNRQLLLMDFHHIIADGISIMVFMEELSALYLGKELPEPEIQYVDFAIWQNDLFQGEQIKNQEAYWLKVFEGEIPVLELPTDFPRPLEGDITGTSIEFEMDQALTAKVNQLAAQNNTTLFVMLLAGFNVLLAKYANQEDIVVGTPIAGRSHQEFQKIIGMFVNTLAMRNQPTAGKTFKGFLNEVSRNIFAAFENQDYQFEMLVEKIAPQRQLNRNPLFDVLFVLQNFFSADIDLPGQGNERIAIVPYSFKRRASKFDLTLQVFESRRRIGFMLDYRVSLFRPETIDRLKEHFFNIFREVTGDPGILLSDIRMISDVEREQLLYALNDTAADFPTDKTVHQLFEEQVERAPDHIALVGPVGQHLTYRTYKELDETSNRLAHLLKKKGVKPGRIVGIMIEQSFHMVVAILAVLKAGSAYLPIESEYPAQRIAYMLKDSSAAVLLGRKHLTGNVDFEGETLLLDNDTLYTRPARRPDTPVGAGDVVYTIYTSGSTGMPKGVVLTHKNLVNYVTWFSETVGVTGSDRALLTSSLAFDLGYTVLYPVLLKGGEFHIIPRETYLFAEHLLDYIAANEITYIKVTPSLFATLVDDPGFTLKTCQSLRVVVLGGEAIIAGDVQKAFNRCKGIQIMNHYGPTESTIGSIAQFIDGERIEEYIHTPTIGCPIHNTRVYIFDKYLKLLPVGVVGELFIAGYGLARGYLNRPELTAEKFIPSSFLSLSASQLLRFSLYRTGDLARWLWDGKIEFLGRVDLQVKIRGYRIEMEEIENHLLDHEAVKEVVVLARKNKEGVDYLSAYIVTDRNKSFDTIDTGVLKDYLATRLPDYMIPSFFVTLERIPVTANGKVDRRALPEPDVKAGLAYQPPADETEKKLVEIWSGVLGIEQDTLSVTANFFELGGQSLSAAVVIARVHKALHVRIPMAELFKTPYIRELAQYIKGSQAFVQRSIEVVEKREFYPLSSAQKRLYILYQMDMASTAYNMPRFLPLPSLPGGPDIKRLESTFNCLIQRHESLRTSFHIVDEYPVQRVHDEAEFKIEYYDLAVNNAKDFVQPFDLSRAPLLRAGLGKTGKTNHLLMVDMHHIVSDGISRQILLKEFMTLYADGASVEAFPPLPIQYKDFSVWQAQEEQQETLQRQEVYWLNRLDGELPVLQLPSDYPRSEVQSFEGTYKGFSIDREESAALKTLAVGEDVTLYMVLLAAFTLLLARLSNQEDIIVGSPSAGRPHADLQNIIGMFVNTLVMRSFPSGEKTIASFLGEVKKNSLEAFENQDYPFESLVEKVAAVRNPGRNPVFDVMFTFTKDGLSGLADGEDKPPHDYDPGTAKFDMTLFAVETKNTFVFSLEYCSKLFKQGTIERFITYFKNILSAILENTGNKISDIEILTEAEKQQILADFNDTTTLYPNDKTIHQLFEEQVARTPDCIAIAAYFTDYRSYKTYMTYTELNEKSNQLAYYLHEQGVKENDLVGLLVNRSIEMIVGILGILKAVCAYVPLNPKAPPARSEYILEECRARVLLSEVSEVSEVSGNIEVIDLGEIIGPIGPIKPIAQGLPTHLCYVIFTSGSTGKPKGVPIAHANLSPLLHYGYRQLGLGSKDRFIQNLSYYFDWSVWEIFIALTTGACLHMVPDELLLNPEACIEYMAQNDITVLHVTPTQYQCFVNVGCKLETLKYLFIGAEKLSRELVQRSFESVNEDCRLFNMYGPTECTIISAVLEIERSDLERFENLASIPIGMPVGNTDLLVLDKYLNLCPVNVSGELYIAGHGVAQGYLNNPELTAERFIGFHRSYRSYISYRTGDVVRWLPEGVLEFLGRRDQQVKIRGFRIELGEIESRLMEHESIKEAVVIDRENENDEKYLCAYIITGGNFDLSTLKDYLIKSLPDYMIPSYFMQLETIPLTPNGKIERRALPVPEVQTGETVVAPANEIEAQLTELWSEVLKIEKDKISMKANFFELGGHSLKATALTARIHKTFDVEFKLTEVFRLPTIRELARYIKMSAQAKYAAIEPVEKKEYYEVSSAQKRLFILYWINKNGIEYNMPAVLELEGRVDKISLEDTFRQLIRRHESLRTSFEMMNQEPVQKVHDNVEFDIKYYDLAKEATEVTLVHRFIRHFDLSQAPLLRVGLIKTAENRHILITDMHHIIADGMSRGILIKEFTAFQKGKELPALRGQYKDYSQWQRHQVHQAHREYWLKEFDNDIPVLNLPYDYVRPVVQSFEGKTIGFELGKQETNGLILLAKGEDVTLFMILLSLFNVLLAKLSGQEDIVVGTPLAGRTHPDLEPIIGMFVNTLALRNYPAGEKTFSDFLLELKTRTLEAFVYQDYPLEELLDQLVVSRDAGRSPLFDVMFVLQDLEWEQLEAPGLKIKPYPYSFNVSKFDMTMQAAKNEENLVFELEYCTKLFKEETIRRYIGYLKQILENILENPGQKISEIEIISEKEKKQLLSDLSGEQAAYPEDKTLHGLFEEQARRTPDAVAVQLTHRIYRTYKDLNEKSNQLAYILQSKGVKPDTTAAMLVERSIEMIIGILAILKAGGAYLPIDPEYPEERINYMLTDSGARILLTDSLSEGRHFNCQMSIVNCQLSMNGEAQPATRNLQPATSLAYIIYTSGTTGKPKGVLIEHRHVVRLLFNDKFQFDFNQRDVWTLFHSYSFDFSVWEMYGALLYGGKLIIIPRMVTRDPKQFLDVLIRQQVTVLNQTPSAFYNLIQQELQNKEKQLHLKVVVFGGEALNAGKLAKWLQRYPDTKLINMFGITETCVHVTYKEITPEEVASNISNIGKPIPTTTTFILDMQRKLQPAGVIGELCVGGEGVGRGYLNRPELTASKFIRNPFAYDRLYCSGDLGKLMNNGDMEYLGRMDHQVQVRGFRIELGEIESHLLNHTVIREAVVIAREREDGETYLCAYIVLEQAIDLSELREYLSKHLPDYMIPSYFIRLETIPLTPNGKLDRRALPMPDSPQLLLQKDSVTPQTNTEKTIAGIWKEVLNLDTPAELGVNVNFFEIGGNSLNIIKVNHKINELFEKKLPVIDMFRYTTIRSLAQFLDEQDTAHEPEKKEEVLEEGKRRGLEIAVIGMAGRFPGAKDIHEFWENLKNGVESLSFFSDPELEEAGAEPRWLKDPHYVKANGILEDFEYFDAAFFNYTPREAEVMDPQMRLFHECAWGALEDAGYNPNSFEGLIGLYAGAMYNFDWETRVRLSGKADVLGGFAAWQLMNKDFLSLRVSYKLNLKGPAVFVQTTCSTSLVAIHMACQALLNCECDMALAGGVSVTLFEPSGYLYQDGMILAPDGHCRAFDAKAKGTIAGNGAGIVALKPLENSVNDGDFIYAVVKGSAINNDGVRKVGFTAPSIEGQSEVIRAAQQAAKVEPESVTYVETHGTGTQLGDPVEIQALKLAFNTDKKNYCAIGSVKTNMGHLDAAAGVTGFIKTVLSLYDRLIPPSLHFENPNPKIDFENSPFYVNTRLKEWKDDEYPLRAGVSSFGMGGTNAHVVLEAWSREQGAWSEEKKEYQLILLSARTEFALEKMTGNLVNHFRKNPILQDAAYTLQVGREVFEHRKMVVCADARETVTMLSSSDSSNVHSFYCRDDLRMPVVFMFPGQGSQYVNMGLELYHSEPIFRQEMDRCFDILKPLMDNILKEILYPDGFNRTYINQTEIAQPVIFAIEYALAKLLMAWGVKPYAMIGHSIGEYVAACLAGVFSLADALEVVVLRGRLMQQLPGGAMLSVALAEEELLPLLQTRQDDAVSLAAVNSSTLCTVSGPHEAIDAFAGLLEEKDVHFRRLHTSHAFHSGMMDPVLETFAAKIREVRLNPPTMPYISNVTGQWISGEQALDPGYWSTHVRKTVRFGHGLQELLKPEKAVFIEVGPGNVLSTFARKHMAKKPGHMMINLIRHPQEDIPDERFLLTQIGRLWLYNVPLQWKAFHGGHAGRRRIPLPTYPFEPIPYPPEKGLNRLDPQFFAQQRSRARKPDMADWFYVPQWNRTSRMPQPNGEGTVPASWMIFMDDHGVGERLVKILANEKKDVILIKKGSCFGKPGAGEYTLAPERPEDYQVLFQELQTSGGIPGKIVHLWNVTGDSDRSLSMESLQEVLETGFYSLLQLARSIGTTTSPDIFQVDVITNNLHEVTGGEGYCPQKALVLGPVKVIPREYPNIRCRSIDIQWPAGRIEPLMEELTTETPDAVVALRGNYRWHQAFEPVRLEKSGQPILLKEKGVYLITGGLGGIGLVLAEHLVKTVQARVILTGRSSFPERDQWQRWLETHDEADPLAGKIRKLQEMEAGGGEALIFSADVSNEKQMQPVIRQTFERFGRIHGVIHAAGVPDGGMIQQRSREASETVLAPKVTGTLLLDSLLKDQPPDFMLLCSSLGSFMAPFGQVAYCSANAFLDAFTHYKNSSAEAYNTTTITINWDTWQQVGMAVEAVKQLEKGIAISLENEMLPSEGVEVFDRIMNSRFPQVAVSMRELTLSAAADSSPGWFPAKEPDQPAVAHQRPELSTKYIEPEDPLEQTLAQIFQDFLGIKKVGIDDNFFELGISSLDLVQISSKLKGTLEKEIPVVTMFTYSTVRTLAQFLQQKQEKETGDIPEPEVEDLLQNTIDLLND